MKSTEAHTYCTRCENRIAEDGCCCGNGPTYPAIRYCAGCNELEGSEYAKHCCTPGNMIEA